MSRTRMSLRPAVAALAIAVAVLPARAEQPASRVGLRVIERPRAMVVGGELILTTSDRRFLVFRVEVDEGDKFWLRGEGRDGGDRRLKKVDELLPLEDSDKYFTQRGVSDPGEPRWFLYRGLARTETQNYDGALSDFDAYIRLRPEAAEGYFDRGIVWNLKDDYDKAIGDYDEAIRLEPELVSAFCARGLAWMLKGDLDRAIRDEDKAIRLDPKDVEAYGVRGWVYSRRGDTDKAIADFTEAIRLAPEDARGHFSRGYVLMLQNAFEGAIEDLSESVRLDPRDHQSLNARAWIWANGPDARLRDGPRAVSSAARACDLAGWRNPSYLTTLAAAYAEMGDFEAAVQWQERSLLLQEDENERRRGLQRLDLYKARKTDRMPPKD